MTADKVTAPLSPLRRTNAESGAATRCLVVGCTNEHDAGCFVVPALGAVRPTVPGANEFARLNVPGVSGADCWDNPITANAKRTGIKDDIQSRLNRYKNVEGFTAVWIWAEKVSDTEYEIYIGYC